MKKKLAIFLILLFSVFYPAAAVHGDELNLEAPTYILIDAHTGQVLYEKASSLRAYPASTTKIMTAIVAMENAQPTQECTVNQSAINAVGAGGKHMSLEPGEIAKLENLIGAMLVYSANDAANVIAENIFPQGKAYFIDIMNKRAAALGATNTHFVNPNGMHDPDHYTTAADLAKLARYAMTFDTIREAVKERVYKMPATNKHDAVRLASTNRLLSMKNQDFDVIGVKTGYTSEARNCLVAAAQNSQGMEVISVMLASKSNGNRTVYTETQDLLKYGFTHFSLQKVIAAGSSLEKLEVPGAAGDANLELTAAKDLTAILPVSDSMAGVEKKTYLCPGIHAPVKQGDVLGYAEYFRNGTSLGKISLVASRSIAETIPSKAAGILSSITENTIFVAIGSACAILVLLVVVLKFLKRHRRGKYKI